MFEVIFVDGRKVQVNADVMFCPQGAVELYKRMGDHSNVFVNSYPSCEVRRVDEVKNGIKELAVKLLGACSKTEPHGSKLIAKLAGVEYTDLVIPVLKKLHQAGKVKFEVVIS